MTPDQSNEMPTFTGNWTALANFTAKLLADRQEAYHRWDDRVRIMAAIAELWRRVAADEDIDDQDEFNDLGAFWPEMQRDLELLARRARDRADRAASRAGANDRHRLAAENSA